MKRFYHIVVIALFTLIYGVSGAQIKFLKNSHDFGEIAEEGGKVEHIFTLRNDSAKPVVIVSAYASCGCTKAEFSRKPIGVGESGEIRLLLESKKVDKGLFHRVVQIRSTSTSGTEILTIKGISKD